MKYDLLHMLVRTDHIYMEINGRRLDPLDNSEFHTPYVSGMAADSSHRVSLFDRETDKDL